VARASRRCSSTTGKALPPQPGRSCQWTDYKVSCPWILRQKMGRHFCQRKVLRVFLRENGIGDAPLDAKSWIAPEDPVRVLRIVKCAALVKKLDRIREGQETVSEALGNVNLVARLLRKNCADPLSKVR